MGKRKKGRNREEGGEGRRGRGTERRNRTGGVMMMGVMCLIMMAGAEGRETETNGSEDEGKMNGGWAMITMAWLMIMGLWREIVRGGKGREGNERGRERKGARRKCRIVGGRRYKGARRRRNGRGTAWLH